MVELIITRVNNGWMVQPFTPYKGNEQDPSLIKVASDTGELADLVTDWAVDVLNEEEAAEKSDA